jgi:hypothetical protein
MSDPFIWWRVSQYGTAECFEETPEIVARINAGEPGWYGNVEGAILHGGVQATAFKRKTEPTYDTAAFFDRGEMIPLGSCTITEITAEPPKSWMDMVP